MIPSVHMPTTLHDKAIPTVRAAKPVLMIRRDCLTLHRPVHEPPRQHGPARDHQHTDQHATGLAQNDPGHAHRRTTDSIRVQTRGTGKTVPKPKAPE